MKHILTCSFGKDSIATALLALQHGEPLDELVYSEVMFSDTVSGELPEHKRFIYETAIPYFEKRGIPTRVLRGQKTYLDCFYHIVSRGNAEGKLASFPLTGRCGIQAAISFFKIFPRSKANTRTTGKRSSVTATALFTLAATITAPLSTFPSCWASRPSAPRGRASARAATGRPATAIRSRGVS